MKHSLEIEIESHQGRIKDLEEEVKQKQRELTIMRYKGEDAPHSIKHLRKCLQVMSGYYIEGQDGHAALEHLKQFVDWLDAQ